MIILFEFTFYNVIMFRLSISKRCVWVRGVMTFFKKYNSFEAHITFKKKKYIFFIKIKPPHLPPNHTLRLRL